MKTILFLLSIPIYNIGNAQQIEKFYDWNWKECNISKARFYSIVKRTDSGWLRQDIFISTNKLQMEALYKDKDCKTCNGWATWFYPNGYMERRGRYLDGKREGTWLSFHRNGMMCDSAFYSNDKKTGITLAWYSNGFMSDSINTDTNNMAVEVEWYDNGKVSSAGRSSNGKQTGPWQYFHKNGNLAANEKYDDGKLLSAVYYDENNNEITDTTGKLYREASFDGGSKAYQAFMLDHASFPPDYKIINADTVTIAVAVLINEEGKVIEAAADVPFEEAFDKGILAAIKKTPKWIPGKKHNRNVQQWIRAPFTFVQVQN